MTVKLTQTEYTQGKHILAIPDHYVNIAIKIPKASAAEGIVVQENGRFIVKAGTVYPSNDNKAQGLIFQDYDVTDGDVTAALMIHGFVRGDRLPANIQPTAAAVMPGIVVLKKVGA